MLCKDKKKWYDASLISEICLCTPCVIARPEQYFRQLKLVKTDQHTVPTLKSLSVILRIKLRPNLLTTFHDQYVDKIVTYWYNQKGRRLNQGKRKKYKKPNSSKKSRDTFGLTISCWILMMIVRLTMIRMTLVQMKTMHTFFTMLSKFYSDDHL